MGQPAACADHRVRLLCRKFVASESCWLKRLGLLGCAATAGRPTGAARAKATAAWARAAPAATPTRSPAATDTRPREAITMEAAPTIGRAHPHCCPLASSLQRLLVCLVSEICPSRFVFELTCASCPNRLRGSKVSNWYVHSPRTLHSCPQTYSQKVLWLYSLGRAVSAASPSCRAAFCLRSSGGRTTRATSMSAIGWRLSRKRQLRRAHRRHCVAISTFSDSR